MDAIQALHFGTEGIGIYERFAVNKTNYRRAIKIIKIGEKCAKGYSERRFYRFIIWMLAGNKLLQIVQIFICNSLKCMLD